MSSTLSDYSVSEIRSAIVDIYGDQTAQTTIGEDGLVEYDWSGSGSPQIKTEAGSEVIARVVKNRSGTSYQGLKLDTDTWTTSANRDAEFEIDGVYPDFETSRPRFIDAIRERLQSGTSGSTVDETEPTDGARSHRDVLTPEESGGLVSDPVDVSGSPGMGSSSNENASTGGLSGRTIVVGAALVAAAIAFIGGS